MKNVHQIREISTLSFNERVLQEAEDRRNPLMERLKFLGIFSSNMDEFFKVRVASIHRRLELGRRSMQALLEVVNDQAQELDARFRSAYNDIIFSLADEGINVLTERDLAHGPEEQQEWLREYFREEILPALVPMIIDKNQPFPRLFDSVLYLGVAMRGKRTRYAFLELPAELPRFVQLSGGDYMYIDDVIRYNLNDIFYIFPYDEIAAWEFKVSRDAELDMDNDFSEGYVRKMERVLEQRKGGRPTRFVYDAEMPAQLRKIIQKEMRITGENTTIAGGRYHNMKDLMRFPNRRSNLAFDKRDYAPHPVLDADQQPMLDIIRQRDLLITYPYQSFDHVIRLLREAAIDPEVRTIKMTLYRAARNSQVVNALYNAARNGKQVLVNIELLARFDEQNNILITEKLSEVGAEVVHGVPPMKVHSKLLVIEHKQGLLAGFSTGNFNEATGRLYVDSMLLTAHRGMAQEANEVFDYLQQAHRFRTMPTPTFKHLLISPFNTRSTLLKLIARETAKGEEGYIFLKVNHLTDTKIIKKLRAAADAGVKMDLVVRTTYAMLPHQNIRAISILDRYLEHQRVYIFGRGDDQKVYMSSADLMERNLDWRVEAAFPILDTELRRQVSEMMALQVKDSYKARILDETQSNQYVNFSPAGHRAQDETYRYLLQHGKQETDGAFDPLPVMRPAKRRSAQAVSSGDEHAAG